MFHAKYKSGASPPERCPSDSAQGGYERRTGLENDAKIRTPFDSGLIRITDSVADFTGMEPKGATSSVPKDWRNLAQGNRITKTRDFKPPCRKITWSNPSVQTKFDAIALELRRIILYFYPNT